MLINTLPESIRERVRVLHRSNSTTADQSLPFSDGQFVLYWMHSAIRTDENPALDAAIHCANSLSLPLLVYQGLSERYPYASDRHHTFILEAARDVQRELRQRGIHYLLNVESTEGSDIPAEPHLRNLARRAAVVITEDMPVAPLKQWTAALGRAIDAPLLLVDTACVLPMQLVGRAFDRAFAFRSATEKGRRARMKRRPEPVELLHAHPLPLDLGVDSLDLQSASIAEVVAGCRIDHAIAPVPGSRGGSVAGYARWEEFKRGGLVAYAKTRNDATRDGTSRLSPYLHYGMVAPMRIAREAAEAWSDGAEKFLDELLIWRELAYNFCFYRSDHGRLSAIPAWATTTLKEHERDHRDALHSWETLARGCTGDALWDAAQRSLLIHGELHNNVRMTWGKALLGWTPNAKAALAALIDLNHRYALDGRDPSSYGGLLWCLGQFDRPFSPPQPVLGTVRPRPTKEHLQRLDLVRYRKRTDACPFPSQPRIAIVGAGISGLACARTLADHRLDVTLFDKSPRVGGRLSTRVSRADAKLTIDHGAQYFTARDERFRRFVQSWQQDGVAQLWHGKIVKLSEQGTEPSSAATERFVGTPDMNAVARHLGQGINVVAITRVQRLVKEGGAAGWQLVSEDGRNLGTFEYVVVAVPAPQALELLEGRASFAAELRSVTWRPSWAVLLTLHAATSIDFDAAFVHQSSLSWIARNSNKPGRLSSVETWLLHSTGEWAAVHQSPLGQTRADRQPLDERVQSKLLGEFQRLTGCGELTVAAIDSHFWRYALPETPLAGHYRFDAATGLACCGDWCGGPRVEGAFLSGIGLAGRLMGHLHENSGPVPTKAVPSQQMLF